MEQTPDWSVFDLADLSADAADGGGPWYEFLRVPDLYVGLYRIEAGAFTAVKTMLLVK